MVKELNILHNRNVVATVHQESDLEFLRSNDVSEHCDLLEYRLDSLTDHLDQVEEIVSNPSVPALITPRCPEEGGVQALSLETRTEIYQRFLPFSALIDIEIQHLEALEGIVAEAKASGVGVVASFHDFDDCPSLETLLSEVNKAKAFGVEVIKFAVTPPSLSSLYEVASLTEQIHSNGQFISTMGMGEFGKVSRLLLAKAGSCLNYGYLKEANAPGQWPAIQLKRIIAAL